MADEEIERLISAVYEKHRIAVKPDDPVFQILFVMMEYLNEKDHERMARTEKQVQLIVGGAEKAVAMQTIAAKETTKKMFQDLTIQLKRVLDNTRTGYSGMPRKAGKKKSSWGIRFMIFLLLMNLLASLMVIRLLIS